MSFGVYKPSMGVAYGHRELSSNHSLHENHRQKEHLARQENPITGERSGYGARRPPSGNLAQGLQPKIGSMDHVTNPDKDVPSKRVDPTKNQSPSLQGGLACVPVYEERSRSLSRLTEGGIGDVIQMRTSREPTPERRNTPGQVVKGGMRPKDNLSAGGCVVADRPAVDPMGFARKAGSGGAGVGSGGSGHLVQGPFGFVPAGAQYQVEESQASYDPQQGSDPYKPRW